jgi:hypothetical protein
MPSTTIKKPSLSAILGAVTVVTAVILGAPSSRAQAQTPPSNPTATIIPETGPGYKDSMGRYYWYVTVNGYIQGVVRTVSSTDHSLEMNNGPGSITTQYVPGTGYLVVPNVFANTFVRLPAIPELDPGWAAGAISLLIGSVLTLSGHRRAGP